ncbi:MAG: inositol monophosphatase family protein, partial [Alphaproteobacteria bacterium]
MGFDNKLLDTARTLADIAGQICRNHYSRPINAERKADASPVTQADREVEAALRAHIVQHFPCHGIFGEEEARHQPDAPIQWVIDPIDGTRAFMAGYPTFTNLIAVTENGVPQLGIINQPITGERWTGHNGSTRINHAPARCRDTTELRHAVVATTSAPYHFSVQESAAFEKVRAQCAQVVVGGDGYGYGKLASGHLDLFIDAGLKPYDFCALV